MLRPSLAIPRIFSLCADFVQISLDKILLDAILIYVEKCVPVLTGTFCFFGLTQSLCRCGSRMVVFLPQSNLGEGPAAFLNSFRNKNLAGLLF